MLNLHRDIHSLSSFKRQTGAYLKQMKKTGAPVVLTVNGKAAMVVQDAKSYQKLLEVVDHFETLEAIREGLEQMQAGKGRPAEQVFAHIRRKYPASR